MNSRKARSLLRSLYLTGIPTPHTMHSRSFTGDWIEVLIFTETQILKFAKIKTEKI